MTDYFEEVTMTCTTQSVSITHFIIVPVVNMREKPDHKSEVVSQAYFSELINLIEENGIWLKIETNVDKYSGWVERHVIHSKVGTSLHCGVAKIDRCAAHLYKTKDVTFGPLCTLPYESHLEILDSSDNRWIEVSLPNERRVFVQRGDVIMDQKCMNRDEICHLSRRFLGLPYTWGGRSSFGYDCSGFTQMLYRQMGVFIPRDSKDQMAWEGFDPTSLESLKPGDLIFFGLAENKIRHVAMYLGDEFIHATTSENMPYIRLSRLSDPEWSGNGRLTYRAARTLKR